jgi:hypothetical protein
MATLFDPCLAGCTELSDLDGSAALRVPLHGVLQLEQH